MRSTGLSVGLVIAFSWLVPIPSALAQQIMMRRTCSVVNGQVVLSPTVDVHRYDIVGNMEQKIGRICSTGDTNTCRSEPIFRFTLDCGGTTVPWLTVFAAEHAQDPEKQFSDGRLLIAVAGKWQAMPAGFAPFSQKFMSVNSESVAQGLPQLPEAQPVTAIAQDKRRVMYGMHYRCDASGGEVTIQPSDDLVWHEVIGDTKSIRYRTCTADENGQQLCTKEFDIWRFKLNCAGDRAVPLSIIYGTVARTERNENSELHGSTLLVVAASKIAPTYPFNVKKYLAALPDGAAPLPEERGEFRTLDLTTMALAP